MFGFIFRGYVRWRHRRRRQLFRYFDGDRMRRADPLVLLAAIDQDPEYVPDKTPYFIAAGQQDAIDVSIRMVNRVFGAQPYDDETGIGLTTNEAMSLFSQFMTWLDGLKKNTSATPTPPPSTDATSNGSANGTTSGTSLTSASKTEPASAEPISIEQESPQPSI